MPKVFEFEIEHVFSQSLFDDPDVAPILGQYGFRQQHRANQVGLYSNPETVAALQDASQAVTDLLKEAGWGANRHDRTNLPDTFQAGKNAFLTDQIVDIARFGANETVTRYAIRDRGNCGVAVAICWQATSAQGDLKWRGS